jgi:hypothetical protein
MMYRKRYRDIPDPDKYILVVTKEGKYWRRKRGTVSAAKLNEACRQNAELMKLTAPAEKRIRTKLFNYTRNLITGRTGAKVSAALRKQLKATGKAGIACMKGMDLQPEHPIGELLQNGYQVQEKDGTVEVVIDIRDHAIRRWNKSVTHYFFELVLLYGDCMKENGLLVESETSCLYGIIEDGGECRMQRVLPEKEWIVLLKVSCMEDERPCVAPRHYGMKVVAAGNGG